MQQGLSEQGREEVEDTQQEQGSCPGLKGSASLQSYACSHAAPVPHHCQAELAPSKASL